MKSKVSRKNTFKKSKIGSGYEYLNSPDIENQLDNVRYENIPDIENQLNEDNYENIDNGSSDDNYSNSDIDKPKNIIEYVPLQKETSIEPIDEDIESNIPSDTSIDLGESGYGVYDKQFYGGITRKKKRNTSKRNTSKSKKSKRNTSKRNTSKRNTSKSKKSKRNTSKSKK
jgi:hypothetical protein